MSAHETFPPSSQDIIWDLLFPEQLLLASSKKRWRLSLSILHSEFKIWATSQPCQSLLYRIETCFLDKSPIAVVKRIPGGGEEIKEEPNPVSTEECS